MYVAGINDTNIVVDRDMKWQASYRNIKSQESDKTVEPEVSYYAPSAEPLPTEAQWEFACRAGSTTRWCFGDDEEDLDKFAWCGRPGLEGAKPVKQKLPNGFGLFDMHGNVSEWCSDRYSPTFYAQSYVDDPSGRTCKQYCVS